MESRVKTLIKLTTFGLIATNVAQAVANTKTAPTTKAKHNVILFIWDGLRPDSITEKDTPNLYRLKQQGTWFADNHSTYPTFTMMNAASFATGNLSGKTGFYGNTLWAPNASGLNAEGEKQDFNAPVFTEDYKILQDIDNPGNNDPIFFTQTLFSLAHKHGIRTATVGKSGPAFMQNYRQEAEANGIVLDEKHIYPLSFAKELAEEGYPLPKESAQGYPKGQFRPGFDNGDPTKFAAIKTLKVISSGALGVEDDFMYPENVTPDPTATVDSPYSRANIYLMSTYLNKILANHPPRLSVIWLRNPDTTEHNYGVGSPSYHTALQDQDKLLEKLLATLKELGLDKTTDLIIASDHSHSNVSGPLKQFPLRLIHKGIVSVPHENGYATSGDFRPADLLTRAGFNAFDGEGCQYDPALSGIKTDGTLVYPVKIDKSGKVCGHNATVEDTYGHRQHAIGHLYTTKGYPIPKTLPQDAIVVANNGGSTYFYVVNHDHKLVARLAKYLQSRQEFGAIFVDDRYADINGTLPMTLIKVKNPQNKNPDLIVSSSFDDDAVIQGMKGTEFSSNAGDRGMHGSFSRTDTHNTLLAFGPDFKENYVDTLPSANVDVPKTIAFLLNLPFNNTDGRPLLESLKHGLPASNYSVIEATMQPKNPANDITYQLATDPNGKDVDPSKTHYTISLKSKLLIVNNRSYSYFDEATALRY